MEVGGVTPPPVCSIVDSDGIVPINQINRHGHRATAVASGDPILPPESTTVKPAVLGLSVCGSAHPEGNGELQLTINNGLNRCIGE